eukprot:GHVR01064597.1.p1 GENE.GHVR01064597.1~~GHVR01064597.1.p1  ORF type:complete len:108 (+),score=9.17 GHVR01064597.1:727-1050(+)
MKLNLNYIETKSIVTFPEGLDVRIELINFHVCDKKGKDEIEKIILSIRMFLEKVRPRLDWQLEEDKRKKKYGKHEQSSEEDSYHDNNNYFLADYVEKFQKSLVHKDK